MGNRKKKDSQYEAVKNHLLLNGDITTFEAIMLYKVTRLAVYIHTLRKEGYSIETEYRHGVSVFGNASTYAKYIFERSSERMIGVEDLHTYGWEAAIRGMRNPMNSWDKSDSKWTFDDVDDQWIYRVGENDLELMSKLAKAGPVHGKFLRMLTITMDVVAPLYWWKEFDAYKVGTVRNSCSTMHKIHAKPFEIADFSVEHLGKEELSIFANIIGNLNHNRECFIAEPNRKDYWWQMIQLLPSSYNQRATIQMNYEVARNIIKYRKDHKLNEWREFCNILIERLPYAEELICEEGNNE